MTELTPEEEKRFEELRKEGLNLKGKEDTKDLGKVRRKNNLKGWLISGAVSLGILGGSYSLLKHDFQAESQKKADKIPSLEKRADKIPPRIEKQFKDISSKLEKVEGNKLESTKILNKNYLALNIPSGKTTYFEDKQTSGLSCYLIPFDKDLKQKDADGKTEFSGSTYILAQIVKRGNEFLVSNNPTSETIEIPTNIKFKRNESNAPVFESYTLTIDGKEYFILENDGAGVSVKGKERHYMPAWILIPENPAETSRIYNEKCNNVSLEGKLIAPVPGKIAPIPTPTPTPKPIPMQVYVPEPPKYGKVILRR